MKERIALQEKRHGRIVPVLVLVALMTGCLSGTHVIPRYELARLAQLPPEERGAQVRVIQGLSGAEEPPVAPPVSTVVIVDPVPAPAPLVTRSTSTAQAKVDDAKIWVIAAALAGLGFAVTEGARFDGWVALHPMHPVHLYGPNGEYFWVPLARLDPQTVAWTSKAFVRDNEGPWRRLGRAPLDRVGFTYSFLLGTAGIPSGFEGSDTGIISHIQLGVFPLQQVGIVADIGLGWTEGERSVFDQRDALELQILPLSAGVFHAGFYGDAGFAFRFAGDSGGSSALFAGGALLQLELTTRLALTARAGLVAAYGQMNSEFGIGLSIY